MMEEWKPIFGYEGLYEVSDHGRVKSLARADAMGRWVRERILKQARHSGAYLTVTLSKNGKTRTHFVHILVAKTFLLRPVERNEVNHIDFNRQNNRKSNLEWVTTCGNRAHSRMSGRLRGRFGESQRLVAINTESGDVREFVSQGVAASELGINQSCISRTLAGKQESATGWLFRRVKVA